MPLSLDLECSSYFVSRSESSYQSSQAMVTSLGLYPTILSRGQEFAAPCGLPLLKFQCRLPYMGEEAKVAKSKGNDDDDSRFWNLSMFVRPRCVASAEIMIQSACERMKTSGSPVHTNAM